MTFSPTLLRLMVITGDWYPIVPLEEMVARVQAAVRGGATSVQVRLKQAPARVAADVTRAMVQAVSVPVLVNDRFDIALAAGAAGVHVGADDVPVSDVRRCAPKGFIIGTSVGCDAEVANGREADFVGVGPIYDTGSKADAGKAIGLTEFTRLAMATGRPAIGIGGISPPNAAFVLSAGAAGVAVIGSVFNTPDPESATRAIAQSLHSFFL